ncbi:unnamed protein product [Staurois parvus]|uniref:NADH dehydrogenase subunit 1 n=1 Tax=Staurois parvus TaxID=386267 RepID=A0ABN9DV77_9NEOB|nr:unnamed protein product [Staurois parvus]
MHLTVLDHKLLILDSCSSLSALRFSCTSQVGFVKRFFFFCLSPALDVALIVVVY